LVWNIWWGFGKWEKVDIIILQTDSVNMTPIYDCYGAIVYSANASNVENFYFKWVDCD